MERVKKICKNKHDNYFEDSYDSGEEVVFKKHKMDDYYSRNSTKLSNKITKSDSFDLNQLNERTRLISINEAFDILRVNIPTFPYERRLSKIDTLHLAISYINLLESVLESNLSFYDYLQSSINYSFYTTNKPIWATSDLIVRLNWLNWTSLGIDNHDIPKYLNLFQYLVESKK